MKQKLLLLLALLGFLLPARIAAIEIGGLNYDLTERQDDDGNPICEAAINRSDVSGNVVLPSTVEYEGKVYSVTAIGHEAFRDCSDLTSIEIPNSITSIGESAFMSCSSLTSIDIPNSVTSIGGGAFSSCGLTSIVIQLCDFN